MFGCDDQAKDEFLGKRGLKKDAPRCERSQSNLWFVKPEELESFGPPTGEGYVWLNEDVKSGDISDPYLHAGYETMEFTFTRPDGSGIRHELLKDGDWVRVKCLEDAKGATARFIYTGMVTDSGRFRYRSVSGETLRLAGLMLEQGIDTDILYANLYLDEYKALKFKSYVYKHMKMTANGVVHIFVDRKMQKKFGLTSEQASNVISYLDSIKGSLIWLAFIEGKKGDKAIRVRLRSRFITVNQIAERHNGGGHDCASGATVYSKKEMAELIREADVELGEYKKSREGWL